MATYFICSDLSCFLISSNLRHYKPLFKSTFFFNLTPTTEIYTLSLHDALPIFMLRVRDDDPAAFTELVELYQHRLVTRSEEHTSELQSHSELVCRLLLEKKKGIDRDTSAIAAYV